MSHGYVYVHSACSIVLQVADYAYTYFAGSFYHCSFCCNGFSYDPEGGMSMVSGSRFSFIPNQSDAIWSRWQRKQMARIFDNIEEKFTEGLRDIVNESGVKRVDFCVGYFNLRGWDLIKDSIDKLPGGDVYEQDPRGNDVRVFRVCRLLIGMHRPDEELIRALYSKKTTLTDSEYIQRSLRRIAEGFKRQLLLGVPTSKDEETLRHLSAQLKSGKVCVKLYLKYPLHAKLYVSHTDSRTHPHIALMGSSNLTYSGLMGNGELNADFLDSDHAKKFADWFDDRWNDRMCLDITARLIEIIDESWAGEKIIPPYYIYLKAAYHLSREARSGIKEFELSPEFRSELFDFQQSAVKIAAKYLNNDKRNGAMIGDVVGLGKTITACAIAKIFEDTFGATTLIICPANLQDMWHKYIAKYNLKAVVHSMAKRIDVENARYYRLIIVDESHNLRNSSGKRYQNIRALIEKQDCKVLLLTATPYNKDFSDLASQLSLFVDEDQDLGIRPENYIKEIGGEYQFAYKHGDIDIRTIRAFQQSRNTDDWNELMKLFLVRRTRSFIKTNYAKVDPTDGRRYLLFPNGTRSYFPDRLPKAIKFATTPGDQYSRLYSDEMIDKMKSLSLPRYGLLNYFDESKAADITSVERQIIDNLSKAGERMMGFAKSTFFKRIDSSGFSYLLTLCRHILRNAVYFYAIQNNLDLPIGDTNSIYDAFTDEDASPFGDDTDVKLAYEHDGQLYISTDWDEYLKRAEGYYSVLLAKNNCSWISPKYFKRTLKQKLKSDSQVLIDMINLCGAWIPRTDQKLNELYKLVTETHPGEKVLVFTQYADTANYLYSQLKSRGIDKVDVATGNCDNQTRIVERFSPVSNEAKNVPPENETQVLIATDVLSEGQNLQDSHIIVNFDLPWAIIRLIQRAGRVDRIGQKSAQIFCYSFFPADGVEKIINLRSRLNDRINENAQVVGSDEVFFEGNEQNLRDMFNEKSGILDDDDDNDVDLSSQAYQIWKNAVDANPRLKQIIPALSNVIYSTKATDRADDEGVITYARTYNDFDVLTWMDSTGQIISQSQKKILQALACAADTPAETPLANHHELVADALQNIQQENRSMGGILGNRFSTRSRIHNLLVDFLNNNQTDTLFFAETQRDSLKLAIDEIYRFPLLSATKYTLGQMLNSKKSADEIVEYVLEMRRTGNFCNIPKEDLEENRDPSIICSMGLKFNRS